MTTIDGRANFIKASFCCFALAIASAGCGMSFEPGAEGIDSSAIGVTEQGCGGCPEGIETTVIQTGPNEYYTSSSTTVNAPQSTVWPQVKNIETLLDIALPGQTTDFEWIEGGPGVVPSLVAFNFGVETLVEEVNYINNYYKIMRYVLVEAPVLGIEEYSGEVDVDWCSAGTAVVTFTREVTFSVGTDPLPLLDLFEQEVVNIRDYYE